MEDRAPKTVDRGTRNGNETSFRRRFLQGVGATGLAGVVAGCLGGGDDEGNGGDGEENGGDGDENGDDSGNGDGGDAVFEVTDLEPAEATITEGETIDVGATIENTGDGDDTQNVEVRVDGDPFASEEVTLAGGESESPSFEDVDVAGLTPDEYTYGVHSEDDEATGTLIVEAAPDPAFFAVSDLEPGDVTVTEGETVAASATIENAGELEGTQDVALEFEGEELASEAVTLEGGESETVDLGEHDTADLEPGEYGYAVTTDDDEAGATLTVELDGISAPYGFNAGGYADHSPGPVEVDGLEFLDADDPEAIEHVEVTHGESPEDLAEYFDPPASLSETDEPVEIEGTEHDALYQTEFFGPDLGFDVTIENGIYDVTIHSAEVADHLEEGDRVFDLSVQGETVAEGVDMAADPGKGIAFQHTVEDVEVADNTLSISSTSHADFTKYCAVEIRADNAVGNPSFEAVTDDQPDDWETTTWNGEADFGVTTEEAHAGEYSAVIASEAGADASWSQDVPVEPDSEYTLSGRIKTEDLDEGTGLGVLLNVQEFAAETGPMAGPLTESSGGWTEVEMTFNSEDNDAVQVNCTLGGWGESTGTAYFDDVSLVRTG